MASPQKRRSDADHDPTDERRPPWSAPRPTPGALGAVHDELFGPPADAATDEGVDEAGEDDEDAEAATDVEGAEEPERSADSDAEGPDDTAPRRGEAAAAQTDVEGASGAMDSRGLSSRYPDGARR
jgi:hypothetical protein